MITIIKKAFFLALIFSLVACQNKPSYIYNEGIIFGTFYHIKYDYKEDLKDEIQEKLNEVNKSLSTFDSLSVLSKINRNIPVRLDSHFVIVFNKAQEISAQTDGAFDMTVSELVNAWGFGFKSEKFPTQTVIDSLMQYVGYRKIKINNDTVYKENPKVTIDASAIAKGYGVDVVANYLESKGIKNYLVEIGGEIRLKGINPKNQKWSLAIDKPIDDSLGILEEYQEILYLDSGAVATSGNYRKFYYKNGQKYSHTINPKTGYPVNHQLLSVTVYTKDCMSADAYATSFMVMGKDRAISFLSKHKDLQVYLIYAVDSNKTEIWKTKDFFKILKTNS